MTTPTFSAISDLYSPTQLRRALWEAAQIAKELRQQVLFCGYDISDELAAVLGRLSDAADDVIAVDIARDAASVKRTALKVGNGSPQQV